MHHSDKCLNTVIFLNVCFNTIILMWMFNFEVLPLGIHVHRVILENKENVMKF